MDISDKVFLSFPKDLLNSPMKVDYYIIIDIKEYYYVLSLEDNSYYMGDNYWIIDQYMLFQERGLALSKIHFLIE